MQLLILSDIHANIEALDAVLAAVPRHSYDRLLVLGDLVGYGASPNEVVDRLFDLEPDVLVRGNHDKVASGIEDAENFNEVAAEAARWTRQTLTTENRERVKALPIGPAVATDEVEICHGTPFDEDVYVFDQAGAARALEAATHRVCFFGHTHVPIAFADAPPTLEVVAPELGSPEPTVIVLQPGRRYLINPGAVGQPRDGDPRAAYGIMDTVAQRVELRRVPYRVDIAQEKIVNAGLPESLAKRLGVGR